MNRQLCRGVEILLVLVCLVLLLLLVRQRLAISFMKEVPSEGTMDPLEGKHCRRILDNSEPLIFVGGIPRSGTTLMRALLDAHELVRWSFFSFL